MDAVTEALSNLTQRLSGILVMQPEDVMAVNSTKGTTATNGGLNAFLKAHPGGFVQLFDPRVSEGSSRLIPTVLVDVMCIHSTQTGAQEIAAQALKKALGEWPNPGPWRLAGASTTETDISATFVRFTLTF